MSLSNIFNILDDVQEFCYVLSHTLQLQELLNYWAQQVFIIKTRVSEKLGTLKIKDLQSNDKCPSRQHDKNCCLQNLGSNCECRSRGASAKSCRCPANKEVQCQSTCCACQRFAENFYRSQNDELKQKISSLEEQIANLILSVEKLYTRNHCSCGCSTVTPKVSVVAPPPPPPPPLPSLSAVRSSPIVIKRKGLALSENSASQNSNFKIDMVKLLRGIKDVKLRPTVKSPGGTPMRRRSPKGYEDTADLIKAALKKRFASIHPEDLSNKENIEDSWENSPNRSFAF